MNGSKHEKRGRKTEPRLSREELEGLTEPGKRQRIAGGRRENELLYPIHFSPEAVDRIVARVVASLRHREAALPAGLDRHRLGQDLDSAIWWYRNWKSVSPSQPWAARLKDCEDGIEAAQALIDWWNSPAGDWRRDQLTLKTRRAGLTFLDTVRVAKNLSRALQRLRAQLSVEPSGKLGARAVRHLVGRESPLAWLVGEHLATIFTRHFDRKAASWLRETTDADGYTIVGKVSAYVAFVLAVLDEAPDDVERASAATIDRARKMVVQKAKKKDPRH